jgi:flagellar hook-associated protein 1 FlgK
VHTFTSTAPGTITLSTTIAGSTLTQTLPLADMAAGDVQTLDFPGLGIRVTLQSSGGPATAAAIIADLTSGAQNDLTVANRNSVEDTYQKLVVNLGVDARGAKNDRINSEALANNLEQRRQSVSSVSLDEEAARLQEHLRAYQAAARVITTFDDMLDHLINNMGTVGR